MSDNKKTSKPAKKPISQEQIDGLIRKYKGKNAVESDCLKSCTDPKFNRYLFVGLSGGVLHLSLEAMTGHMRARQSRKSKRDETKIAKGMA
jgi:hypothetical protein